MREGDGWLEMLGEGVVQCAVMRAMALGRWLGEERERIFGMRFLSE